MGFPSSTCESEVSPDRYALPHQQTVQNGLFIDHQWTLQLLRCTRLCYTCSATGFHHRRFKQLQKDHEKTKDTFLGL
jgi:hypothetical protein